MGWKTIEIRREYGRKYYKRRRGHVKLYQDKYYREKCIMLNELKRKPCMDCEDWFEPCQMEFDHRDASTKSFAVSECWSRGLKTLLEEIAKCDLVCANCHRLRTHLRRTSNV